MRQDRADSSADFHIRILASSEHTFTFLTPITDP